MQRLPHRTPTPNDAPMPIQISAVERRTAALAGTPLIEPIGLPWSLMQKHRSQAMRNHGQSLEVLRMRGGLSACEAVAILEGREWHPMDTPAAFRRLAELVAAATPAPAVSADPPAPAPAIAAADPPAIAAPASGLGELLGSDETAGNVES